MRNCQTIREHWDGVREAADLSHELRSHLEGCPDCQQFWEQSKAFDSRLARAMSDVEIPDGLRERLLSLVDGVMIETEEAWAPSSRTFDRNEDDQTVVSPTKSKRPVKYGPGRFVRATLAGLSLAFMLAAALIWFRPEQQTSLNFAEVKSSLDAQFLQVSSAQWNSLPAFDDSFQLTSLDRSLRSRWQLSAAAGMDLGLDAQHDAAVYRFQYRQWAGTLIVLPTTRLQDAPDSTLPTSGSGQRQLTWQSADGLLTYVCYVDSGSGSELMDATYNTLG